MKRDMDLIRNLLLKLEALELPPGVVRPISPYAPELAIDGSTPEEIGHHLRMLVSGHLVETAGSQSFGPDGSLVFRQLTWGARDFLDSVRDPETWAKTKKVANSAGGFTLDLLKDIAKGYIKKQVEELSGVKIG